MTSKPAAQLLRGLRATSTLSLTVLFCALGLAVVSASETVEPSPAKDFDAFTQVMSDLLIADWKAALQKWTAPIQAQKFSSINLTTEDIRLLYTEFKATIVTPPHPDRYTVYEIPGAEESLDRVTRLGKRIHNMLIGLPDEDIEKWGKLLHEMRDVLFLDAQHLPLAIKHNNSRDVFWYDLHNTWLNDAEVEFTKLGTA